MSDLRGDIIEESLEDQSVLKGLKILSTRVEKVTKEHQTPWLSQWTLHTISVPEAEADVISEQIRTSLECKHTAWYADFKNEITHYIIFPKRIFCVDRTSKSQYDEAKQYGISLGIPEYQVDFHPDVKQWER